MSPKKQAEEIVLKPKIPLEPIPYIRASDEAQTIARSLSLGRLTHAALLLGDELLCRDIFLLSCAMLSENEGILAYENPDVILLHGGDLTVESAESLMETLAGPPHTARRMIYIDGAGRMSEYVQNKLLKTLEEPPPDNGFVLSGPDGLLPTVFSRCMQARVPDTLHNDNEKRAIILSQAVSRDTGSGITHALAQDCLELSGYALDSAYKLASDSSVYELHVSAFDWFAKKRPKYLHELPAEFVRSRVDAEFVLSLFSRCISDMILIKQSESPAFFTDERKSCLEQMARRYELRELIKSFDLCLEAIERLFSNVPARQTMDNLYARSALLNRI